MNRGSDTSGHLLFGLLALQNGLIDQGQLDAAFQAWTRDKGRPLAEYLAARGDLDPDQRAGVEAMVALHLKKHGGDVAKSLAALPGGAAARRSLAGVGDPDLEDALATMPHEPANRSRITLAETDAGADGDVTLAPAAAIPLDGAAGRYELLGEIARGGMGAVLRARDSGLGRELALKVLLDRHRDRPDLLDRFVEEAQICGQLQHPGVVPVYDLGSLGDRRPYFTMKLVKGRTLAALLDERTEPDLPRFLSIFEAICQTLAYAHARGVIHRDLKPSNVMVGSFGEVQVMDWGLAKVLPRDGQPPRIEPDVPAETVVATLRSKSDSELSQAGSVLGTPAYMAPEQARGETDRLDRRADVFALGSILCEVLTGQPAFTGSSAMEILTIASRGDTAGALARLEGCGAEAELIALARDCLAVDPAGRPADASMVAERLTAYLSGVQDRLRDAELARAQADARAVEERKRRRLSLALAATILVAGGLGGAGWRYVELQRLERSRQATDRVNGALREATRLRGLAQGAPVSDAAPWAVAAEAAENARDLLEPGIGPALRQQVEQLAIDVAGERKRAEATAEADRRDRKLLDALVEIRSAEADDPGGWGTDAAYTESFRDAGYDAAGGQAAEVAASIRARPAATAVALAAALDDWAAVRRDRKRDRAGAATLAALARATDPDPWRNGLRGALDRPDRAARLAALRKLAETAPFESLGPISLHLLGRALADAGDPAAAETVLRRAQRRNPDDVWCNYDLAEVLDKLARRAEAIRYYTAARALRPETAHGLAHALERLGEGDEAIAVFEDLRRLRPRNGWHLGCLAVSLKTWGRSKEAAPILEEAVAAHHAALCIRPDDALSHFNLGWALVQQGKAEEAIAEHRAALRIHPDDVSALNNLGWALAKQGNPGSAPEALEHARKAVALEPTNGNLHNTLALAEYRAGHLAESIAAAERSIELQRPNVAAENWFFLAMARARLGQADRARGDFEQAVAWTREHDPKNPELLQFWREAAALLGRPGPDAEGPARLPADVFAP